MKRFVDLAELGTREVRELLALAHRLEEHPEPRALAGRVLGLLFLNPSLRTLASFQSGMARLGGSSLVITPGQGSWQLEARDGVVTSMRTGSIGIRVIQNQEIRIQKKKIAKFFIP